MGYECNPDLKHVKSGLNTLNVEYHMGVEINYVPMNVIYIAKTCYINKSSRCIRIPNILEFQNYMKQRTGISIQTRGKVYSILNKKCVCVCGGGLTAPFNDKYTLIM